MDRIIGSENWVIYGNEGSTLVYAINGRRCEIIDIIVPSEVRRKRYGHAMIDLLCQLCKRKEIDVVYAITRAENRIAQKFYESLRFDVAVLRDFYQPGIQRVDALLYSRSPIGPV